MTNNMQLFGLFICTQSALHVSGDFFAHHQEQLTVFTASDIVHLCFCRHRWTISEAVNIVNCSWWWVKTSPETRRADWVQINKPKVSSCWSSITNHVDKNWLFVICDKQFVSSHISWIDPFFL